MRPAQDVFRPRESAGFGKPKTRPLYVKLEMLLDLMFRCGECAIRASQCQQLPVCKVHPADFPKGPRRTHLYCVRPAPRRLYMDPTNPEAPFNYDSLLKLIKKLDKDLGP